MDIIELIEVSPSRWRAKYKGNYGVYTIKLNFKGTKLADFSCSCPSDNYPCKHIAMIEKAIKTRLTEPQKKKDKPDCEIEDLLTKATKDELCKFIIRLAKNDIKIEDDVYLTFMHKIKKETSETNRYSSILRKELHNLDLNEDYDFDYNEEMIDIEVLDSWFDKAKNFIEDGNHAEAILICKACIEEFAEWFDTQDEVICDLIDEYYRKEPFVILFRAIPNTPTIKLEELLQYALSEILKPIYQYTNVFLSLNELIMKLSVNLDTTDFLSMQDRLWECIENKDTHTAKALLDTKIEYFKLKGQVEKAWDIKKDNLHVESYREEWVKKLIAENKLTEAKHLIDDIKPNQYGHIAILWSELRLKIAQKEKNAPETRKLSFDFIKSRFVENYYKIYKATFSQDEWQSEFENLIKLYNKSGELSSFNSSTADLLKAEGLTERLMNYVEKSMSFWGIMSYYKEFSIIYPEKTLAIFRMILDKYAEDHTGERYYYDIADAFKKMKHIKSGEKVVEDMKLNYRILYKRRKLMLEIIK